MQTKFTPEQKQMVRDLMSEFKSVGGQLFQFPEVGLTIAMIPDFSGSRMANIGVSWQAPSEKKFRKLVGADLAINRADGCGLQVPVRPEFFQCWAENFAHLQEDWGSR